MNLNISDFVVVSQNKEMDSDLRVVRGRKKGTRTKEDVKKD